MGNLAATTSPWWSLLHLSVQSSPQLVCPGNNILLSLALTSGHSPSFDDIRTDKDDSILVGYGLFLR